MVFSSHLFVFYFLPLALLLYYAVLRRGQHLLLTLLSYVFYGWANPLFVILMFVSTVIDYVCGLLISGQRPGRGNAEVPLLESGGPRSRRQKVALAVSICSNLSLLGFFKYFNFGVDSYNALVTSLGFDDAQWQSFFRVTLPLGISFYTFQSMSYSIDVYRGDARAIRNFIDFACYVAMFPQLVAGPIIRFQDVADQLRVPHLYGGEVRPRRGILFASAWPRRFCSPTPAARWPTWRSTPVRSARSTPGWASWVTRFRSTSTSAPTPTWRSAWG